MDELSSKQASLSEDVRGSTDDSKESKKTQETAVHEHVEPKKSMEAKPDEKPNENNVRGDVSKGSKKTQETAVHKHVEPKKSTEAKPDEKPNEEDKTLPILPPKSETVSETTNESKRKRTHTRSQYENVELHGADVRPKLPPKTYQQSKINPPTDASNAKESAGESDRSEETQKTLVHEKVKPKETELVEPSEQPDEESGSLCLSSKNGDVEENNSNLDTSEGIQETETHEPIGQRKTEEANPGEKPNKQKKEKYKAPKEALFTETAQRVCLTPTSTVLPNHPAYHGIMDSEKAEETLRKHPVKNCYLLRYSTNLHQYTLSIKYNSKLFHVNLEMALGYFSLENSDEDFESLDKLLENYQKNPLNESIRSIGSPCTVSDDEQNNNLTATRAISEGPYAKSNTATRVVASQETSEAPQHRETRPSPAQQKDDPFCLLL